MRRRILSFEQALIKAEELCARAEHSSGEIRDKLQSWGMGYTDSEQIISRLQKNRFLDDSRYARAFVSDKVRFSGWGKRKISLWLYKKGVPREILQDALETGIDENTYKSTLVAALIAKRRTLNEPDSYESLNKLFRFAVSRGFEPYLVSEILHNDI